MLAPDVFASFLIRRGLSFFTGVPDSLLKEFCAYVSETQGTDKHVITANEGGAVALAAGHYLATRNPGVVYLQNSGLGNALNPLVSLADGDVYGIPMLLIVGWRGEPGVKDEPQHVKQGRIQEALVRTLGYRYEILSSDVAEAEMQIERLVKCMREQSEPVFLLVRKGVFSSWHADDGPTERYPMSREEVLEEILLHLEDSDRIVSTTGKTSREIYELREKTDNGHHRDFLTVGSMGHAGMIALGVAIGQSRRVVCIDGDGAALMHMGSMAILGARQPANYIHIVINNGAHESVGGQPTVGFDISFTSVARDLGYAVVHPVVETRDDLKSILSRVADHQGLQFVEIRVRKGARSDLGRPMTTPVANRDAFMGAL